MPGIRNREQRNFSYMIQYLFIKGKGRKIPDATPLK